MTTSTQKTKTSRKHRRKSAAKKPRRDIYQEVTNRIVEHLETGVAPWVKPWSSPHRSGPVSRPLRHNGEAYRGVNVLMLWIESMAKGYDCPLWLTFNQTKEMGGHVRKGETSTEIVFFSTFTKDGNKSEAATEDQEERIPFLKTYRVFNASQCEGLPNRFYDTVQQQNSDESPVPAAQEFVRNTKAEIIAGGNRAFYRPADDVIGMPAFEKFRNAESHAATLSHELLHWSGHKSRLDRDLTGNRFADDAYAVEELVAEMGAAFLCADLSITPEVREDHASYLQSWLNVLKQDKKAIFTAASMASKAVDYLHGLQPAEKAAEES
ncbi:MAG: zincin-like metallopeptidase domain-containing protein [Fuerstiella sp.]